MVGTIDNLEGGMIGLIKVSGTKDMDSVYQIKIGDYLGRNHGQVQNINLRVVEISEIVSQGRAGNENWQKRSRSLELINQ